MIKTDGEEFRAIVKGENFITPKILDYYVTGDYLCELSQGTDFDGNKVFGVTVANAETGKHEHGLSKLWETKKKAIAYIAVLGQ